MKKKKKKKKKKIEKKMFFFIALFLLAILILIILKEKKPKNAPPEIGMVPWFGCFISFAMDSISLLHKAYEKYGDCFTLKVLGKKMTFLVGPEAQTIFFRANDDQVSAREAYQFMVPVFGKGVVYDSPLEDMYAQLKFIKSGLIAKQLKKDVPLMLDVIDKFISIEWQAEKNNGFGENLLFDLNRLTILTATRCLMGPEIHSQMWGNVSGSFADLYHDLEGGILPISFFFPHLPLPQFKKRDAAREQIVKVFSRIIKARRSSADVHEDILAILMEAAYKDGRTLSDAEIAGMLISLLFAGQHTSSISGTWTLVFLLRNPEYLAKVMDEQARVLAPDGKYNGELSFEALRDMPLLEYAVRETLRVYPPLIHLMRVVKQPLRYKDYVIPAGNLVCVSPGMSHQVDSVFADAKTWRPERWLEFPDGVGQPPKYTILSFGGGRHGCIGEQFGVQQIKTILSVLLRRFDFELLNEGMPPPDYTNMVVGPTAPLPFKYKLKK